MTSGYSRHSLPRSKTSPRRLWLAFGCVLFILMMPIKARSVTDASYAVTVPNTTQWNMTSPSGDAYQVMVYAPDRPAPPGGFPIIYMLDGNATFPMAVESMRVQQASAHGSLSAAIIVGIGYPGEQPFNMVRRAHDYTPMPREGARHAMTEEGQEVSYGGAEALYQFIQQQVKPAIEKRFRINPGRQALFGHSYGALFTLTTLFRHPDAFNIYIAASPSLWWGEGMMKTLEKEFDTTAITLDRPVRVLITVGEYEQALSPTEKKSDDASEIAVRRREHQMINNAQDLARRLKMLDSQRIDASVIIFPQEYHRSVLPVALNRAMRFILSPDMP